MYIVGLTGGIGSGKSIAAARFSHHGVGVINSDQLAREIVAPGTPALASIIEKFGQTIVTADGHLNRKKLRNIIFANDTDRQWLEALTHPLIGQLSRERAEAPRKDGEPPYRILEIPLLFESARHNSVNRTLLIDVEEHHQIQRVIERDNSSEQQVKSIIASQMPSHEKRELADDIVENNGSNRSLHQQIDALHELYCSLGETYARSQP